MTTPNPLEALHKLKERLQATVADLGLELHGFAIIPGGDGVPDTVQCVFAIDTKIVGQDAEKLAIDKQVEQMDRQMRMEQREAEEKAVTERIRERMARGGTFLDWVQEEGSEDV